MAFINDNTSERRDFGGHHIKQDNRPAIEQKYTSDEMEAAHALLALSNSAPNAPPVHKTVDSFKSGLNVHSASVETERKLPKTPEPSHQAPLLNTVSQVSPLTELDCFVAAAVTDEEQRYVYNHYNSSHDEDWTEVKCENHGLWACDQCFHAVNP
ncbi:uncharacterized protein LOC114952783 [Acropora millepora]|uniref:uncharacterized protein LOC114952783 n=1 Tax=Acropora millepora TaxID=45264 RepID=UPI001CF16889|nr:uncharacterized protein LOC114952783 [Acropora millepora]